MDLIRSQFLVFGDVSSFVSQHLLEFLKELDWLKLAPVILAVLAKVLDDAAAGSRYSGLMRLVILFGALVAIFNVFSTIIHQPHVDMPEFVRLLLFWGAFAYLFICDLLLIGLAHQLNKLVPRGRWIRELEYPYLILGLVGLFVTINRMTMLEHRITDYDLYGPLILVTATVLKFVKTRAEVAEWAKL